MYTPGVLQGDGPSATSLCVTELDFIEIPEQSYLIGRNEKSQTRVRVYSSRSWEKADIR